MAYENKSCGSVTLASIDGRCDTSMGGIKAIMIANRDDVTATVSGTDEKVDSITLATGAKFEKWQFRKNTGNYSSSYATDPAIGNTTVTTTVSLQFSGAEATKRVAVQSALNANAVVLVQDMYDEWIYLGMENEVTITECTMQSGTATGDLSGFNLTFTDIASELPHFIDEAVDVSGLLVAGA